MSFEIPKTVKIIEDISEVVSDEFSYFNISNRTYTKRGTDEEVLFMKKLQSKLIKFTPIL